MHFVRSGLIVCCGLTSLVWMAGCGDSDESRSIVLATTTSTRDSGLLDELIPLFESRTGIRVKSIAVGTGQALEMGRRGDADVLLTHAPRQELDFMRQEYGQRRESLMANDFVIVGPPSDPAELRECESIAEVFQALDRAGIIFVSRGDQSGTHLKEQALRREYGADVTTGVILETGSGMAQTLRVANEKRGYTLTDRGTFLALSGGLDLRIAHEGPPEYLNPYSVIVVSSTMHPHVDDRAANDFVDFLLSAEIQSLIADFGRARHGQPLFYPGEHAAR